MRTQFVVRSLHFWLSTIFMVTLFAPYGAYDDWNYYNDYDRSQTSGLWSLSAT